METTPATVGRTSPFVELDRHHWSRLAESTPFPLTDQDIERLRGLGDRLDLQEVNDVYRPLSRLLNMHVESSQELRGATGRFLKETSQPTPFVIGVAGSVAVGKSTTSRLLQELLARWPSTPRVELVTTDGFLFPNEELERRGLMNRKGFPESYDRRKLVRFVADVKAGAKQVAAPVYSHLVYDIVPDAFHTVSRPDVLIVEGLNVLQAPALTKDGTFGAAVSDFFDFSIYVDARTDHIRTWYRDRFLRLKHTAFAKPDSYFRRYAALTDQEAVGLADSIWDSINGPNLEANIRPTRGRADLILQKNEHHQVARVLLRKI